MSTRTRVVGGVAIGACGPAFIALTASPAAAAWVEGSSAYVPGTNNNCRVVAYYPQHFAVLAAEPYDQIAGKGAIVCGGEPAVAITTTLQRSLSTGVVNLNTRANSAPSSAASEASTTCPYGLIGTYRTVARGTTTGKEATATTPWRTVTCG